MRLNASSYSARILHHVWWCYRASVCAFGITSLSLSDSCNISFILSHSESPNHQPTDTLSLSQSTQSQRTDVPRRHDGPAHSCAVLYILGRPGLPAYQTGGLPRMPAPARVCDIPDKRATPVWRMEESSRHKPLVKNGSGWPRCLCVHLMFSVHVCIAKYGNVSRAWIYMPTTTKLRLKDIECRICHRFGKLNTPD